MRTGLSAAPSSSSSSSSVTTEASPKRIAEQPTHLACAKLRDQILTIMRSVDLRLTPDDGGLLNRSQGNLHGPLTPTNRLTETIFCS